MKPIRTLILVAPLLLLGCSPAASPKAPAVAPGARHASSPKHFWFDYHHEPSPGKRYWTSVGETWIEQYESGIYSRFKVAGRTTLEGASGTLVVKITGDPEQTLTGNDGDFQAFIPDVGSANMQFWCRNKVSGKWEDWRSLAEMQDIE